jgi:hypothetical protein
MTDTLTLRYDNETHRVTQTYWGTDPDWTADDGTTITTTQVNPDTRQQQFELAISAVSDSDYDPDTETPIPQLTYDPDADAIAAEVDFVPIPDSL